MRKKALVFAFVFLAVIASFSLFYVFSSSSDFSEKQIVVTESNPIVENLLSQYVNPYGPPRTSACRRNMPQGACNPNSPICKGNCGYNCIGGEYAIIFECGGGTTCARDHGVRVICS
ncbi:MAG: hypothetical protein AABW79_04090 [Nanoarchaeota archaeon]